MEISDNHIIKLIDGQARTAQALTDLKGTVEKGFKFIHGEHTELEGRVRKVEKKVWYATGAGAAVGYALSYLGIHLGK
jgi:hypothetical protein